MSMSYLLFNLRKTVLPVASEDHTDSDCILIALMTHGDDGILYAKDQQYKPEKLWSHFTSDQCPTLAGKPKIFFIQVACRKFSTISVGPHSFLFRLARVIV